MVALGGIAAKIGALAIRTLAKPVSKVAFDAYPARGCVPCISHARAL